MADHEKCGGCGAVLASPIESQKVRVPCTACGSVVRMIEVSANDTLEVHESLAFKQKGIGHKKPTVEGVGGDEFFRKEQKWVSKVRLIDREANHYQEKVTDPAKEKLSTSATNLWTSTLVMAARKLSVTKADFGHRVKFERCYRCA